MLNLCNSCRSTNLHEAIRDALVFLDDNGLVDFGDFDSNGDGYLDMLTVLHSGYGAGKLTTLLRNAC